MKTRLIFVRHAEAEGNVNRKFHGFTDSKITQKGHVQAKLVSDRLKNIYMDVLYSSSLTRTLETAGYIAAEKQLPIIRTDKLKEINGGEWEGVLWEELPKLWPKDYDTWENKPHIHQMPSGESMEEFQKRLLEEVLQIADRHRGQSICIVTHGTAIKALMCYFLGCKLEEMLNIRWYDNTSVTIIEIEGAVISVLTEGDASHLGNEMSTLQNQTWFREYQSNQLKREK